MKIKTYLTYVTQDCSKSAIWSIPGWLKLKPKLVVLVFRTIILFDGHTKCVLLRFIFLNHELGALDSSEGFEPFSYRKIRWTLKPTDI